MRILFIGDIVGKLGRAATRRYIEDARAMSGNGTAPWDFIIANGENAAGGLGITPAIVDEMLGWGIDVVTGGNHTWRKRELLDYADRQPKLIRPANHPPGAPGFGHIVVESATGMDLAVVSLQGRVYMDLFDCPFRTADHLLADELPQDVPILIDFHAEATAEKIALRTYLDGRVAAIVGTHTHVPTADAMVTEKGTAYITDVGMTGPIDSVIGMKTELALHRFLTQMPARYDAQDTGPSIVAGVQIEIDPTTRLATKITRIEERYPSLP